MELTLYDQYENKCVDRTQIRIDDDLQPRVEMNADIITEYAERMLAGDVFPEIRCLRNMDDGDDSYFLIDGYHRFFARTKKLGKIKIDIAVLGQGSKENAKHLAAAANKTNGLHRTNADKRKAVKMALESDIDKTMSDREIARHCGVDNKTVASVRYDLSEEILRYDLSEEILRCADVDSPQKEVRKVTRNGKVYQQNVANIGKSRKASIVVVNRRV